MGIKHFFIWYKKNNPDCIRDIKWDCENIEVDIDNLCLDMNGIFHQCAQKVYEYGNYKKEKRLLSRQVHKVGYKYKLQLYQEVCNKITFYINLVKPKKRVILCVDGVAGKAKMFQQRQRRFKSAKEAELSNENSIVKSDFDSAYISPGTQFMDYLTKYIDWYIRMMMTNDNRWSNLEVIFSNEKVPGEGEHKIVNYIRKYGSRLESYMIHGLDADLIMLALGTELEKIYILRENIYNDSILHILDIHRFSKNLLNLLRWKDEDEKVDDNGIMSRTKNETFNKNRAIDDFIFMCFMVGNDFVPTIPTLAILEGGIDIMIDVYKNVCKEYGHLTRSRKGVGILRMKSLEVFLGTLAQYENNLLVEKQEKKDCFLPDPLLDKHTMFLENGKCQVNFEDYKSEYYTKKFPEGTNVQDICHLYLQGLQWVIMYYKVGIPDWSWFYKFYYGPFLCDLSNYCKTFKFSNFELNEPVSPFLQLLYILPPQNSYLLPTPLDKLLTSPDSPIIESYPLEFTIDTSGKRKEWEGIVILPYIDISKIKTVYEEKIKVVEEKEKRRNKDMSTSIYKLEKNKINYVYKSYYGNIENCKIKLENISL